MTIGNPWTIKPISTDEQIRADEEMLLKAQIADADKRFAGEDGEPTSPPAPEAVRIDPVIELAAFAQLLGHLEASDDGDTETVVSAITADTFAEENFAPVPEEPRS